MSGSKLTLKLPHLAPKAQGQQLLQMKSKQDEKDVPSVAERRGHKQLTSLGVTLATGITDDSSVDDSVKPRGPSLFAEAFQSSKSKPTLKLPR